MAVKYDFSKLDGRIIEKFGTYTKFAKALGISVATLSLKRHNQNPFSVAEIEKSLPLLEIDRSEIPDYYFVPLNEVVANPAFDPKQIEGYEEFIAAVDEVFNHEDTIRLDEILSDNEGEGPNPLSVMEKYPKARDYWLMEQQVIYGSELAKEYLKKLQDHPEKWDEIIEEYRDKGGFEP
ncbi:MAG: DUF739 family protein [Peptococcaceae bacterium]|nr:DUF739 family protein [Peptococcaceae bacterium]